MNVSVEHVSKNFGPLTVIDDITFEIKTGSIVCLLGPSGSGKTTIIRLILGALVQDKGDIFVGGEKVPNLNLLRSIGFMPQSDALYDDLTGEDNIRFFAKLYGMSPKAIQIRLKEIFTLVDLNSDKHKYVKHYSGGMKKRLSLAIALFHNPDLLILDEPTVGIDPVLRRIIWDQFKALQDMGKTLIVSTHVMDEVYECDKVALIYEGRLIHFDTLPNTLVKTPSGNIVDLFVMAKQGALR